MRLVFVLLMFSASPFLKAQFSPDGGQAGSIAVHKDSVQWKGFATAVDLEMGWLDIADSTLGKVDLLVSGACLGPPDLEVQPLGDGGVATVTFAQPFGDEPGYDFVVFENGFATSDTTGFFELAFVEVSSNGIDFFRFPNTSLSRIEDFAGPFAELDSRLMDGFAGRFSAPYGAPFDLSDLASDPLLDLKVITHVRVIDVIGTAASAFAKTDSDGMVVIDPYPTAYATGGFDLDAVGVISPSVSSNTQTPAILMTTLQATRTKAIRRGQLLLGADSKTVWLNAVGAAVHQGEFAPDLSGHYLVGNRNQREEWQQCFVY